VKDDNRIRIEFAVLLALALLALWQLAGYVWRSLAGFF
jgi:hypothetical protein